MLVVSYTAVSPLPRLLLAVCFLWHCPAGCPGWALPTTLPCGARTFLGVIAHDAIARPTRSIPGYWLLPANLNSVLILLPPSEGKTPAARGQKLNLTKLSFPELTPMRESVLRDLVKLSSGSSAKALTTLGLSKNQLEELDRNKHLLTAHTQPASAVYTGVLYDALDFSSLSATAKKRATNWVAISSALFGLVRFNDHIPPYRLSGDVTLGRGPLSTRWRQPVQAAIVEAAGTGVVFDLRSGSYVKLGPIAPEIAENTVVGRVLLEKGGKRSVVSHFNKASKGRLVRELASTGTTAGDPVALAAACKKAGFHVELSQPQTHGKPWTMEIVVSEV